MSICDRVTCHDRAERVVRVNGTTMFLCAAHEYDTLGRAGWGVVTSLPIKRPA